MKQAKEIQVFKSQLSDKGLDALNEMLKVGGPGDIQKVSGAIYLN